MKRFSCFIGPVAKRQMNFCLRPACCCVYLASLPGPLPLTLLIINRHPRSVLDFHQTILEGVGARCFNTYLVHKCTILGLLLVMLTYRCTCVIDIMLISCNRYILSKRPYSIIIQQSNCSSNFIVQDRASALSLNVIWYTAHCPHMEFVVSGMGQWNLQSRARGNGICSLGHGAIYITILPGIQVESSQVVMFTLLECKGLHKILLSSIHVTRSKLSSQRCMVHRYQLCFSSMQCVSKRVASLPCCGSVVSLLLRRNQLVGYQSTHTLPHVCSASVSNMLFKWSLSVSNQMMYAYTLSALVEVILVFGCLLAKALNQECNFIS